MFRSTDPSIPSIPLKNLKVCSNHLKRPPPYFSFKMGHPWHPPKKLPFWPNSWGNVVCIQIRAPDSETLNQATTRPKSVLDRLTGWTETKYPDTEALKNASAKRTSLGFWVGTALSWFFFVSGLSFMWRDMWSFPVEGVSSLTQAMANPWRNCLGGWRIFRKHPSLNLWSFGPKWWEVSLNSKQCCSWYLMARESQLLYTW